MSSNDIHLTIDGRDVTAPRGQTVLDAARALGANIPTLCHSPAWGGQASCLVCVVRDERTGRMLPSCSARVEDGMRIDTDSAPVREARRSALELLLSDHTGDCEAPCARACPGHLDVPAMLRRVGQGLLGEALREARRAVILPSVLGRICPAPCERGCRRKPLDAAIAIGRIEGYVGDSALDAPAEIPTPAPDSGKRIAVVGAGPAGLAAAATAALLGHRCTVFEAAERVGGALARIPADTLPPGCVSRDAAWLERLGVRLELGHALDAASFDALRRDSDAVILAVGADWRLPHAIPGLELTEHGVRTESQIHATSIPGVFAAGAAAGPCKTAIQAIRLGKEAAAAADLAVRGHGPTPPERRFNSNLGRPNAAELFEMLREASAAARMPGDRGGPVRDEAAVTEAARCLHCDCRRADDCRLRDCAQDYGARPSRFAGERRPLTKNLEHPDIVYEPGKCISCGLCVRVSAARHSAPGLCFEGRGFPMRVAAPFHTDLTEALRGIEADCVNACPTGALAWRIEELDDIRACDETQTGYS